MMGRKLVLYGAGQRCRELCGILNDLGVLDVLVVDSNLELAGTKIGEYSVERPEKIRGLYNSRLCITIADQRENSSVREKLIREYGYREEQIVSYDKVILDAYAGCREVSRKISSMSAMEPSVIDGRKAVLFDCYNGLGPGGVEAWTMDLCNALIERGDRNVYIISDQGEYDIPDRLRGHILNARIDHHTRFSKDTIWDLIRLIMEKMPCQVVACAADEVMLAAYLVKKNCPNMVRVISVIHNSNETTYARYMEFQECPDIHICVSQDIRNNLVMRGIRSEQIYLMTCPFACEERLCRSYTEDVSLPVHIGYAGRMEYEQKRMDLFLKLMMVLKERHVKFIMEFAGDGAARREMEEFVVCNGLGADVKFHGWLERTEIGDFWKRQDICVNLADFEGKSISMMEGMAGGAVPVITETSGARDDITDGVDGYIIPIGDYNAAADRIAYLVGHRGMLRRMGMLAHDAVYPKSSMETHVKFWDSIRKIESEE